MLNEEALNAAIAAKIAPKITLEMMEARIAEFSFISGNQAVPPGNYTAQLPPTVTLCNITLDNGYSVRGESACVSPENFDFEIGKTLAYKQAVSRLWPLFGFLLAESLYVRSKLGGLTVATEKE